MTANFTKSKEDFNAIALLWEEYIELGYKVRSCREEISEIFVQSEVYKGLSSNEKRKIEIEVSVCSLYKKIKMFHKEELWNENTWYFNTYSYKESLFENRFFYLFSKEETQEPYPICKKRYLHQRKSKGKCVHKLERNWWLLHSYKPLNKE